MAQVKSKEKLLDEIDTYDQSINAIYSIKQHLEFKFQGKSHLGRRLKTSQENAIQQNDDITPDIVTQFDDNTGLVGEIKIPSSAENEFKKISKQMKKYDDDLFGWDTASEKIKNHDLYVVTHQRNAQVLAEYLKNQNDYRYNRKLAVFSFNIDSSRNTFFVLEKRGGLLPEKFEDSFRLPCNIKAEYVFFSRKDVKFYDGDPPPQYTMWILWDFIFSTMPTEAQFRESLGRKTIPLTVSIDDIIKRLKPFVPDQNGSRVPTLPKKVWIQEALDKFVEINQAEKNKDGTYTIKYLNVPKKSGERGDFVCSKLGEPQQKITEYDSKSIVNDSDSS